MDCSAIHENSEASEKTLGSLQSNYELPFHGNNVIKSETCDKDYEATLKKVSVKKRRFNFKKELIIEQKFYLKKEMKLACKVLCQRLDMIIENDSSIEVEKHDEEYEDFQDTTICKMCKKQKKLVLKCTGGCKSVMCIGCIPLSEINYKKMNSNKKGAWKCRGCQNEALQNNIICDICEHRYQALKCRDCNRGFCPQCSTVEQILLNKMGHYKILNWRCFVCKERKPRKPALYSGVNAAMQLGSKQDEKTEPPASGPVTTPGEHLTKCKTMPPPSGPVTTPGEHLTECKTIPPPDMKIKKATL